MDRDKGRNNRRMIIYGLVFTVLVFAGASLLSPREAGMDRSGPRGTQVRDQVSPRRTVNIDHLQSSVEEVGRAIEREAWEEADASTRALKERWLSFRSAMQGQAGREMWHTREIQVFDEVVNELPLDISRRRRHDAQQKVDTMQHIIERHQQDQGPNMETETLPLEEARREQDLGA